ncbi:MAG TPA: PQQ-dependent sugar dehydrogenase [Lacipirellulaceae bacterium]|nr:PQQ-dependent sugar dehydrogenase [Lacipirellulaceae bacterium]
MLGQTIRALIGSAAVLFLIASPIQAQTYLQQVAWNLEWPTFVASAPSDSSRLFVGDGLSGKINLIDPVTQRAFDTPVLQIADLPAKLGSEQGLLGMAFDPNYATNGYFYVDYTAADNSINVRRYQMTGDPLTSIVADPNSGVTILNIPKTSGEHNGGWLGFSPNDGDLYITVGDDGGAYDTGPGHTDGIGNAQDLNSLQGKILRIDVHGDDFPDDPNRNYAIPASNPFVGKQAAPEIWAYGFRNPWRASFDRQTGDLWIGDVGQNNREEIDFQPANSPGGQNYGWRLREGTIQTPVDGIGGPSPPGVVDPIYDYDHIGDPNYTGAAVIGGYVYHGSAAAFDGLYLFADLYGNLWALDPDAVDPRASVTDVKSKLLPNGPGLGLLSAMGEDSAGEVYVLSLFGDNEAGLVYRVATNSKDVVWNGTSNTAGAAGDGVSWTDARNWTRGGVADAAFVAEDNVVFAGGSSQTTIDLGANQTVAAVTFNAPYKVQNHTLTVLSGNITVQNGVTATIDSDLSAQSANFALKKLGLGTLLVNGHAGQTVVKAGTLGGVGSFDHLSVRAGATLSPGVSAEGTSVGLIAVSQSFTLAPGSHLSIEIGGADNSNPQNPNYDQLIIGGAATLSGTLNVSLVDLGSGVYSPAMGESFPILTAGSIAGKFEALDLPALPTGLTWKPIYGSTTFSLDVVDRLPGDYNGGGHVGPADYVVWRSMVGQTGGDLAADSSGPNGVPDGVVDNYDYLFWREHFGDAATSQARAASVPEPSAAGLVAVLALTLVISAKTHRSCDLRRD